MTRHNLLFSLATALVPLVLIACGGHGDAVVDPLSLDASQVEAPQGQQQHGIAGDPLLLPLVVRALDGKGAPLPGVKVRWSVTAGGGTIHADAAETDSAGRATATWTLGAGEGDQSAVAFVGTKVVPFTAHSHLRSDPLPLDELRLLAFKTFEGSGEVTHPDVVRFPAATDGADRYLALTPYPGGAAAFENPSIFSSHDGVSWWVPTGASNPVAEPDARAILSDPDIVYVPESRELWLYYREVADANIIMLKRSRDGVHWGAGTIVATAPNHLLVSPAVERHAANDWSMWSVSAGIGCQGDQTTVERRRSTNGITWSAPTPVELTQPGFYPWHIDVNWIAERNEYWALYNVKTSGSCTTPAVYLATSPDGDHWTTYPAPVLSRGAIPAFADVVYRSTFEYDASADEVTFWFSGAVYDGTRYTWHAATERVRRADLFTRIARRNTLIPRTTTAPRFTVVP